MAYVPNSGSVVAFQSDPTKLVGTVSVVGTLPVTQATTPWIIGSVYGNISGSVSAWLQSTNASIITVGGATGNSSVQVLNFPANQSVSGAVATTQQGTWISSIVNTVPSSVIVGASAFGTFPVTQVTNPWTVVSSIAGGIFPVSGSVATAQIGTWSTSVMTNIITSIATAGQVMGSVAALQGTNPWITRFANSSIIAINAGSVVALSQGSVITVLQSPSIVGTYAEDAAHTSADKGIFVLGVRNDAVASFMGSNLEYGPNAVDSAGRTLTKPFSAEESRVEGYNSVVSTSVTTLVAAAGAGLRNYITDVMVANTGATTTLVTFRSGGGTSVLGYTIAPTAGGSNMTGLATPFRTLANETFDFQATSASSILFVTVKGFKAP